MKKPDYYKTPLRSREKITDYLMAAGQHRAYDGERWLFCFNVKLHRLDLSFENLVKKFKSGGYFSEISHDSVFMEGAAAEYAQLNQDHLYEWALEDARGEFVGRNRDDGYRMLWDGTKCDTEFQFMGRSGGWLTLTEFDGYKLGATCLSQHYLDFKTLFKLYRFIVMFKADFTRYSPEQRVEDAAAFTFFENTCSDVPSKKDKIAEWEKDQSGEHDTPMEEAA